MSRLRHSARLVVHLFGYCAVNRRWWVVPIVLVSVVFGGLVSVGATAVPYSVYTLF